MNIRKIAKKVTEISGIQVNVITTSDNSSALIQDKRDKRGNKPSLILERYEEEDKYSLSVYVKPGKEEVLLSGLSEEEILEQVASYYSDSI